MRTPRPIYVAPDGHADCNACERSTPRDRLAPARAALDGQPRWWTLCTDPVCLAWAALVRDDLVWIPAPKGAR